MKKIFLLPFLFVLIGCGGSGGGGGGHIPFDQASRCPSSTDATLFDTQDYYNQGRHSFISAQLAVYQWHIYNFGQKAGTQTKAQKAGEDINVVRVWQELGFKGSGVTIAIIDTGTDADHIDLKANHKKSQSYNYHTKSTDPYPIRTSGTCYHGTATAGIAVANGFNRYGVVGVAPEAGFAGLNVGLGCGFSADESGFANALSKPNIDIYSNSWGCGTNNLSCFSQSEIDSVEDGVALGRGGKGSIYLFASGNDNALGVNANYFAEQNRFEVISVAAANSAGNIANYSNWGANVLISGYGGDDPKIVTTDISGCDKGADQDASRLMKHRLNSSGEYTHTMSGTSAATPMVAGVVALMLEARPTLSWRDVRYILATTARKTGNLDQWQTNGAGHQVSHDFGFGIVDAYSAVKKAQTFASLPALISDERNKSENRTIGKDEFHQSTITVPISINRLEFVDIFVDIESSSKMKLEIDLIAPSGIYSALARDYFALPIGFFDGGFRFGSVMHLDESNAGNWKLVVVNKGNEPIKLKSWKLKFHGRSL